MTLSREKATHLNKFKETCRINKHTKGCGMAGIGRRPTVTEVG